MKRYDLVQVNACYTTDHQMEASDDGEWVRYEDVEALRAGLDQSSMLNAALLSGSCKCGVFGGVSHYCSALDHCWVGKREQPNPDNEHLAANGKPIDGYPRQQA